MTHLVVSRWTDLPPAPPRQARAPRRFVARARAGALPALLGLAPLFCTTVACLWSEVASAACDEPATAIDVIEATESSADAYGNADLMGFIETTSKLEALLPCLQEPLPRNVAASVHRMMGLRAFVDKKKERAEAAFGAARAIEPKYRFPETMVPPQHPIMTSYVAIDPATVTTKKVPTPEGGYLHFDGRPSFERPVEVATLTQWFEGDGAVRATSYLWPTDGMIDYPEGQPATPPNAVVAPVIAGPVRKGPNVPLLIGAGGAAVAATVMYGLGASSAASFNDPAAPYEDGSALRARTNTFAIASGGAGVVALGLGVGAVVAGRW